MQHQNQRRNFWHAQAVRVRRRVNLAWWLESISPPVVVLSLVSAAALLWVRREFSEIPQWQLLAAVGISIVGLGAVYLGIAWKKFEKTEDSLVRIEAAMGLRNALTTAEKGITSWPAPVEKIDSGLHWQWPRLGVPFAGSLMFLSAGLWIPVKTQAMQIISPPQPQAWGQLSAELEELRKDKIVEKTYLEETQKRLDELKAQQEDQWFSHSSLEATDSLKKSHQVEVGRMSQNLGKAQKALNNLEQNTNTANEATKERQMEEFQQALQGLQSGAMKPNAELLEQMQNLDLENLTDISPEELEQLRENLQKHQNALKNQEGGEENADSDADEKADEDSDRNGEGKDGGQENGQGGVDRGPGHDPKVIGKARAPLEIGAPEKLEAKDLSHATPGDLLELQNGKPDTDQSPTRPTQGGNTNSTGKGGDRVWKESLNPDEQRVMKRFFE